jgi:hypothetical protein
MKERRKNPQSRTRNKGGSAFARSADFCHPTLPPFAAEPFGARGGGGN